MRTVALSLLLALAVTGCVSNLRTPRGGRNFAPVPAAAGKTSAVSPVPASSVPAAVAPVVVRETPIPAPAKTSPASVPEQVPAPVKASPASVPEQVSAPVKASPASVRSVQPSEENPLRPIEIRRPEQPPEIPADPTVSPATPVRKKGESAALSVGSAPKRELQTGSVRIGDVERLGNGQTVIRSGNTVVVQDGSGSTLQSTKAGKLPTYLIDSRGKVTGPTAISTSATASDRMPSQPFLAPRPTGETRSSKDGPAPVTGYTPGARQSFSNMPQRSAAPSPLRR